MSLLTFTTRLSSVGQILCYNMSINAHCETRGKKVVEIADCINVFM
jgi:hypothetical protein